MGEREDGELPENMRELDSAMTVERHWRVLSIGRHSAGDEWAVRYLNEHFVPRDAWNGVERTAQRENAPVPTQTQDEPQSAPTGLSGEDERAAIVAWLRVGGLFPGNEPVGWSFTVRLRTAWFGFRNPVALIVAANQAQADAIESATHHHDTTKEAR